MVHTSMFSFFLLILSLAAIQHTHAVEYAVIDNTGNSGGGVLFKNKIGVDYSLQTLSCATDFVWKIFQQNNSADRKDVKNITLFIENSDGVAFVVDNEIHFSANYLGNYSGHDHNLKREFTGVLYHETARIWQWDGKNSIPVGLIQGIADFVRLKAKYIPSHWVYPGFVGSSWDQGYDVTARFLDYCNSLGNGFVAKLNKKLKRGYSAHYFVDLLGKSVDQLWSDYNVTYNGH